MSRLSLKLLSWGLAALTAAGPLAHAKSGFLEFDDETEAKACIACNKPKPAITPKIEAPPVPKMDVGDQVSVTFRIRGRNKPLDPRCRRFLDENGNYGDYGRAISALMNTSLYNRYYTSRNSLSQICPKFATLNDAQKTKAWTWFWMVLANEESDCNVNKSHGTHFPNGRRMNPTLGWGMFAGELFDAKRAWRGRMCQGSMKASAVQIRCAVATMSDTQLSEGRGVLSSESYWGPVRRYPRQIVPNMRGFKSCF